MALEKITQVSGTAVHVAGDDIDTDRIIPARFMKCVTFDGLGAHLFHDVRFDAQDRAKGHPLDAPAHQGATVLIAGQNFGCGSSREHAPQALWKFGFRAVVAGSFAEIFFGNCTTLGLPCVALKREDLDRLAQAVTRDPRLPVLINLLDKSVQFGTDRVSLEIKAGARSALLEGQWDAIGLLLEARAETAKREAELPYLQLVRP